MFDGAIKLALEIARRPGEYEPEEIEMVHFPVRQEEFERPNRKCVEESIRVGTQAEFR